MFERLWAETGCRAVIDDLAKARKHGFATATSPSTPPRPSRDARFDGVFVLRTNTDLDPLATMLRYKQLWTVEAIFRTAKHLLATRPISTSSMKPSAATCSAPSSPWC